MSDQTGIKWRCPLCGEQAKPTAEHVITRRSLKKLPDPMFTTNAGVRRRSIIVRVCRECNSWMNEKLEIPTQELRDNLEQGRHIVISIEGQKLLAAYMTKHVLMINLWSSMLSDPSLTPRIYRRFRATMRPPDHTRVWFGRVEDPNPQREQAVVLAVPEAGPLPDDPKWVFPWGGTCHVFTFYHLVVVWERVPHRDGRWAGERLIRRTAAAGLITRIWPPQGNLAWPPEAGFESTTYARWSHRFAAFQSKP